MEWINEKAKTLKQGAIRAMFDRANTMTGVISLGIGEPDMPTPKLVCEACKEALDKGITHYTPNAGTLSFRQAIAEKSYLKDLHYDPKTEIIITNGGMGALSLLFLVLLNKGDEILIQDPQWLNYVAQVAYCDGTAVRVPTDLAHNFEMQPETIEKLITPHTKALMINTPNNPTGSVMTRETMAKIAELAVKHDLLVISDDVYNTLLYAGEEAPCIASFPGMKERTVIVNSFSKSYAMTGWRIGFVAAPAEIVDRMTKCQENFNACANAPGQYAATVALDHPELCEELRQVFERRRSVLLDGLAKIDGIRCNRPNGAFYVFADISSFGLSSVEFCNRLLDEQKVVCIRAAPLANAVKASSVSHIPARMRTCMRRSAASMPSANLCKPLSLSASADGSAAHYIGMSFENKMIWVISHTRLQRPAVSALRASVSRQIPCLRISVCKSFPTC